MLPTNNDEFNYNMHSVVIVVYVHKKYCLVNTAINNKKIIMNRIMMTSVKTASTLCRRAQFVTKSHFNAAQCGILFNYNTKLHGD